MLGLRTTDRHNGISLEDPATAVDTVAAVDRALRFDRRGGGRHLQHHDDGRCRDGGRGEGGPARDLGARARSRSSTAAPTATPTRPGTTRCSRSRARSRPDLRPHRSLSRVCREALNRPAAGQRPADLDEIFTACTAVLHTGHTPSLRNFDTATAKRRSARGYVLGQQFETNAVRGRDCMDIRVAFGS